MSQYPIIKIPPQVEAVKTALPPEPKPPTPPQQPEPEPKKLNMSAIAIETAIAAISVPIFSQITSIPGWLLLLLAVGAIAFHAWYQIKTYPQRKQKHNDEVADYPRKLSEYDRNKRQHEEKVKEALSPEKVAEFRYKLLLEILRQTVPHDGNDSKATIGGAEARFSNYLNKYFPNKIYRKLTLNIPNFEYPYSPDFAYIDREINLYIDIEVDEPYVYNTSEPTHYLGAQKDSRRNQFFLNKGWIIIRFSEEQVICYPHSCCKTVAQVISQITGNSTILNEFISYSSLQLINQWTKEEAVHMVASRTRDNYKYRAEKTHQNLETVFEPIDEEFVVYNYPKDVPLNTKKARRKIRKYFKNFFDSHKSVISLDEIKQLCLDNLATQSTETGKWVRNNRAKAESFLKDWEIND